MVRTGRADRFQHGTKAEAMVSQCCAWPIVHAFNALLVHMNHIDDHYAEPPLIGAFSPIFVRGDQLGPRWQGVD